MFGIGALEFVILVIVVAALVVAAFIVGRRTR